MVDFLLFVVATAGIYAIFSLGLLIQFGIAGLPNFGNGAFMAVSSYTMAILVVDLNMPMIEAAPLAIVAAVLFGLVLAVPTIRLRSDYLAIATIAAGEIVRYLALNLEWTGGAAGTVNLLGPGQAADYNFEWIRFQAWLQHALQGLLHARATSDLAMCVVVWPVALILCGVVAYMVHSPWGRVLRAIREDQEAADALGKNVFRYKLQAFSAGAALAGLAGLFFAWQVSTFTPDDFKPTITFYAFVIVILGGKTNVWAVPIGSLAFTAIFSGTRFLGVWPLNLLSSGDSAFLRLILVGAALVVLVIWRPQGIFGNRQEHALEN